MKNKKNIVNIFLLFLMVIMLAAGTSAQVDAAARNGLVTKQGKTYYYKNGKIYKGWLRDSNGRRYFELKNGVMYKGIYNTSRGIRYFDRSTGYMYVGLKKQGGNLYYFDPKTGFRFNNGFKTVGKNTYYFRYGRAVKGWLTLQGNKYYFSSEGIMYKNTTATLDGKKYKFSAKGIATEQSTATKTTKWQKLLARYKNSTTVNQLVFVKYEGGTRATVELYNRVNGSLKRVFSCPGYVGNNGINKVREGDRKTPTGTFGFTKAFGIKSNPGSKIPYTKLNKYLYWCGDKKYYNTMVDVRIKKHNCVGEHLITYNPHYNYALAIDYNPEHTYKKGSAIFLHCTGSNPYTGGCVAVSERYMKKIMQTVDQNAKICIYSK